MGGTEEIDTPSRIILLCGSGTTGCHGWIERFRKYAYDQGWLVHRWQDCEQVPLQHALYGLVYLLDDGLVVSATTGEIGTGEVPGYLWPQGLPQPEWDPRPTADVSADGW